VRYVKGTYVNSGGSDGGIWISDTFSFFFSWHCPSSNFFYETFRKPVLLLSSGKKST